MRQAPVAPAPQVRRAAHPSSEPARRRCPSKGDGAAQGEPGAAAARPPGARPAADVLHAGLHGDGTGGQLRAGSARRTVTGHPSPPCPSMERTHAGAGSRGSAAPRPSLVVRHLRPCAATRRASSDALLRHCATPGSVDLRRSGAAACASGRRAGAVRPLPAAAPPPAAVDRARTRSGGPTSRAKPPPDSTRTAPAAASPSPAAPAGPRAIAAAPLKASTVSSWAAQGECDHLPLEGGPQGQAVVAVQQPRLRPRRRQPGPGHLVRRHPDRPPRWPPGARVRSWRRRSTSPAVASWR